jgi:hypothetical protein
MWDEAYTSVCRRHPDVVAAFESPHGRVALLLRQTLTPPSEERSRWLVETRRAAREVTTSLRDAGLRHDVTILQWRPLPRATQIMVRWDCCYEGEQCTTPILSTASASAKGEPSWHNADR